jgi:ankyrin repeat protein
VEPAPSLEKVQYLVEQRPTALKAADTSGSLPLHVGVSQRNVSRSIVQFLVEQRPQSLRQKDGAGLLPLHVAAVNDAPLDILYYLASKKPESIYENVVWREPPRPHKRPKLE